MMDWPEAVVALGVMGMGVALIAIFAWLGRR